MSVNKAFNCAKYILFILCILIFALLMINIAFLEKQTKEVKIQGKYETLPYSLLVNTYAGRGSYQKKVMSRPEEYFISVQYNQNNYLIQTTKEIYEKADKNKKINVSLTVTRIGKKVNVDNLGINVLSNEQLANREESIRTSIK